MSVPAAEDAEVHVEIARDIDVAIRVIRRVDLGLRGLGLSSGVALVVVAVRRLLRLRRAEMMSGVLVAVRRLLRIRLLEIGEMRWWRRSRRGRWVCGRQLLRLRLRFSRVLVTQRTC